MNALRPEVPKTLGAAAEKAEAFNSSMPPGTGTGFAKTAWLGLMRLARFPRSCPSPGTATDGPNTVYGNPDRKAASSPIVQSRSKIPNFDLSHGEGRFQ